MAALGRAGLKALEALRSRLAPARVPGIEFTREVPTPRPPATPFVEKFEPAPIRVRDFDSPREVTIPMVTQDIDPVTGRQVIVDVKHTINPVPREAFDEFDQLFRANRQETILELFAEIENVENFDRLYLVTELMRRYRPQMSPNQARVLEQSLEEAAQRLGIPSQIDGMRMFTYSVPDETTVAFMGRTFGGGKELLDEVNALGSFGAKKATGDPIFTVASLNKYDRGPDGGILGRAIMRGEAGDAGDQRLIQNQVNYWRRRNLERAELTEADFNGLRGLRYSDDMPESEMYNRTLAALQSAGSEDEVAMILAQSRGRVVSPNYTDVIDDVAGRMVLDISGGIPFDAELSSLGRQPANAPYFIGRMEDVTNVDDFFIQPPFMGPLMQSPLGARTVQGTLRRMSGGEIPDSLLVTPSARTPRAFKNEIDSLMPPVGRLDVNDPNQIFVFGSNLEGIHGAGAAKVAAETWGAQRGVGRGLTGRAYAFPTKRTPSRKQKQLSLKELSDNFDELFATAQQNPGKTFMVSPVGTGLGGYDVDTIARLIAAKRIPANVRFVDTTAEKAESFARKIAARRYEIDFRPGRPRVSPFEELGSATSGPTGYGPVFRGVEPEFGPVPLTGRGDVVTPTTIEFQNAFIETGIRATGSGTPRLNQGFLDKGTDVQQRWANRFANERIDQLTSSDINVRRQATAAMRDAVDRGWVEPSLLQEMRRIVTQGSRSGRRMRGGTAASTATPTPSTAATVDFSTPPPAPSVNPGAGKIIQPGPSTNQGYRSYVPRTIENAQSSDITIAVASNFETAGERLTYEAARGARRAEFGRNPRQPNLDYDHWYSVSGTEGQFGTPKPIAQIPHMSQDMGRYVDEIVESLNQVAAQTGRPVTINGAGNGIARIGSQAEADTYARHIISRILEHPNRNFEIGLVRSGGQNGYDIAFNKAAKVYGIPTEINPSYHPSGLINIQLPNGKSTQIRPDQYVRRYRLDTGDIGELSS